MADSVNSTPKRKRGQLLDDAPAGLDTASFSFDLHAPVEDGSASPRSRVAHRFRGLAIESGGGVGDGRTSPSPQPRFLADDLADGAGDGARKRVKFPDSDMGGTDVPKPQAPQSATLERDGSPLEKPEVSSANQAAIATADPPASPAPAAPTASAASLRFAPDPTTADAAEAEGSSAGPTTGPSLAQDEASGGKPRSRKRAGTPPLTLKTNPAAADLDSEEEAIITDRVRASLTWHEDEITVYDPDDSEDDGTGINGIGFKPTPAIAYARNLKRRQQLAEYRKREDREARARRSRRRRGSPAPSLVVRKEKAEQRRVRFMESAAEVVGTV